MIASRVVASNGCTSTTYQNSVSISTTRLFADDTVLYNQISSPADASRLQSDLDALTQWDKTWMMEFNPSKYQVLRITLK